MGKVAARKRKMLNYQSFYIQVDDCKPSYSFSLNASKHFDGPLWEHLEVTLHGTFLSPKRMKGLSVPLVFLGRRDDQAKLEKPTESDAPQDIRASRPPSGLQSALGDDECARSHCVQCLSNSVRIYADPIDAQDWQTIFLEMLEVTLLMQSAAFDQYFQNQIPDRRLFEFALGNRQIKVGQVVTI